MSDKRNTKRPAAAAAAAAAVSDDMSDDAASGWERKALPPASVSAYASAAAAACNPPPPPNNGHQTLLSQMVRNEDAVFGERKLEQRNFAAFSGKTNGFGGSVNLAGQGQIARALASAKSSSTAAAAAAAASAIQEDANTKTRKRAVGGGAVSIEQMSQELTAAAMSQSDRMTFDSIERAFLQNKIPIEYLDLSMYTSEAIAPEDNDMRDFMSIMRERESRGIVTDLLWSRSCTIDVASFRRLKLNVGHGARPSATWTHAVNGFFITGSGHAIQAIFVSTNAIFLRRQTEPRDTFPRGFSDTEATAVMLRHPFPGLKMAPEDGRAQSMWENFVGLRRIYKGGVTRKEVEQIAAARSAASIDVKGLGNNAPDVTMTLPRREVNQFGEWPHSRLQPVVAGVHAAGIVEEPFWRTRGESVAKWGDEPLCSTVVERTRDWLSAMLRTAAMNFVCRRFVNWKARESEDMFIELMGVLRSRVVQLMAVALASNSDPNIRAASAGILPECRFISGMLLCHYEPTEGQIMMERNGRGMTVEDINGAILSAAMSGGDSQDGIFIHSPTPELGASFSGRRCLIVPHVPTGIASAVIVPFDPIETDASRVVHEIADVSFSQHLPKIVDGQARVTSRLTFPLVRLSECVGTNVSLSIANSRKYYATLRSLSSTQNALSKIVNELMQPVHLHMREWYEVVSKNPRAFGISSEPRAPPVALPVLTKAQAAMAAVNTQSENNRLMLEELARGSGHPYNKELIRTRTEVRTQKREEVLFQQRLQERSASSSGAVSIRSHPPPLPASVPLCGLTVSIASASGAVNAQPSYLASATPLAPVPVSRMSSAAAAATAPVATCAAAACGSSVSTAMND